jgi:hypothetical protein
MKKHLNLAQILDKNRFLLKNGIYLESHGSVAQLYSALDFGSSGCRLESCRGHKIAKALSLLRQGFFVFQIPNWRIY